MRSTFVAFTLALAACRTSSFTPGITTGIRRNHEQQSSGLSMITSQEVADLKERSPALPFLSRPQKCKGYIGDVGFDPMRFSEKYPMEYLREAELKHGRVCMLAWCGWVAVDLGLRVYPVPQGWGGQSWDQLTSLTAHDAMVSGNPADPQGFWYSPLAFILYICLVPEWYQFGRVKQMVQEGYTTRNAGDLSWDFLGFTKDKTEEEVNELKLAELKHARLGMLAFSGVVVQSISAGADSFPYIKFVIPPIAQ